MRARSRSCPRRVRDPRRCGWRTAPCALRRPDRHLLQELPPRDRIEAGHGLVQHQQLGLVTEREQDRQLLPLADRHVLDVAGANRPPTRRTAARSARRPSAIERGDQRQLIGRRELIDELVLLRHEADARFRGAGQR